MHSFPFFLFLHSLIEHYEANILTWDIQQISHITVSRKFIQRGSMTNKIIDPIHVMRALIVLWCPGRGGTHDLVLELGKASYKKYPEGHVKDREVTMEEWRREPIRDNSRNQCVETWKILARCFWFVIFTLWFIIYTTQKPKKLSPWSLYIH